MSKKIKLQIKAQEATPAPPVGPQIGALGINIMEFCRLFNDQSKNYEPGSPVVTVVTIEKNKKFSIELLANPTSYLIRQRLKKDAKGQLTISTLALQEVVDIKLAELTAATNEAALKIVAGTALSMGVKIL